MACIGQILKKSLFRVASREVIGRLERNSCLIVCFTLQYNKRRPLSPVSKGIKRSRCMVADIFYVESRNISFLFLALDKRALTRQSYCKIKTADIKSVMMHSV